MDEYATFLDRKTQAGSAAGFAPLWMPDFLFDFQRAMTMREDSLPVAEVLAMLRANRKQQDAAKHGPRKPKEKA